MKRTREVYEYINIWLDELKPEVTEIVTEWMVLDGMIREVQNAQKPTIEAIVSFCY